MRAAHGENAPIGSAPVVVLAQIGDRLGEPAPPGFGTLGPLDRQHMAALVAVGQGLENPSRVRFGGGIGRHLDPPRFCVEGNRDLDLVAGDDPGGGAVLGGERDTMKRPPITATVER